ncbi:MAG: NAD(P)-dependent oxidoreductase [Clostridiales bacterium]|nr:NAD(P)-dependent oxidoreductase [Clostridiales bacterium]
MKYVIVTGATGFIGGAVVRDLICHDYHVIAIVRPESKNLSRIQGLEQVTILTHPLEQISDLVIQLKVYEPIYFFHIAWDGVSGENHTNPMVQLKNIETAINCVKIAKEIGCKRFIGAGSIHEIEGEKELSVKGPVVNGRDYYKVAKRTARDFCRLEASLCGLDFLWPQLTNTYGEGEFSDRLINATIRKLQVGQEPSFTKGDQLYDFIYITDVARAYRYIAEKGKSFENYKISSGNIQPLKNYLMELGRTVNEKVRLNFGSAGNGVYLDKKDLYNDFLSRDTNFLPKVSFAEGIKKTMEWLEQRV